MNRRIVFFGGKGGVGKTTLAAAFAVRCADRGARTLLVSTDPAHSTSDILQTTLSSEPSRLEENLWALEIDPASEADRYIAGVQRRVEDAVSPRIAGEVRRQIEIARVSPGAEESAVFERFSRIMEEEGASFDRIVFDTAPTGHTLRLLSLPELMSTWISGLVSRRRKANVATRAWRRLAGTVRGEAADGEEEDDPVLAALRARQGRFERARATLTDPERTAFAFVLIPERLPILETERAVEALDRYGIPVGAIFVNRVLPDAADGEFMQGRRRREAGYLASIEESFAGRPLVRVPLREDDVVGIDALRELGADLWGGGAGG